MHAVGLQTHIWNNNLKSVVLLAGFPVLLALLSFALHLLWIGAVGGAPTVEGLRSAAIRTRDSLPFAALAAAAWFGIAWLFHQQMISASTGARGVTRTEEKELYNLLENLCISRGLPTPKLAIIETPALNAFASGVSDRTYTVTLTRGLIDKLDKNELRAVMAHELTHIMNRDVRLLIVAVIFVGIFSFVGEIVFRNMFRIGVHSSRSRRSTSRSGDSRGSGLLILIAVAVIALAYALAIAIRFSLSRKREYLADAGAVELTKDPDAMISALEKISGRAKLDAPGEVEQMFIENDAKFLGVFATHPPIDKRIEALREFAGGRAND